MRARTDRHRNPAAITTDLARQAGLVLRTDYEIGEAFQAGSLILYTALFLGDPLETTLRVIDKVGFYTKAGAPRWSYIAVPPFLWQPLDAKARKATVAYMYSREGGTEMKDLLA